MARKWRNPNAQEILKSDRSTRSLRLELEKSFKMAQERMNRLKEAGLSKSEFYREHRKDFKELEAGNRLEISKELARVNRFLNAKSSTVKGLKEAEAQFIEAINKTMGEDYINANNVRRFQAFMNEYKDKYQEQTNIQSDTVVDAFLESERLMISKSDMLANLELFAEYKAELKNLTPEDILPDGAKLDRRRRFKLDDYFTEE